MPSTLDRRTEKAYDALDSPIQPLIARDNR